MNDAAAVYGTSARRLKAASAMPLAAVGAAMAYPFLLQLFHHRVAGNGAASDTMSVIVAGIVITCAMLVPVVGFWAAMGPGLYPATRRLAYATVIAPTLYGLIGVGQALLGITVPDTIVWCLLWLTLSAVAYASQPDQDRYPVRPRTGRWRVLHGISAAVLCLFVLFHVGNHLAGLRGPAAHAAVMDAGRVIYRSSVVEPMLLGLMLCQVTSGLYLAWRWSGTRHHFYKTFQIASGAYLSVFILGHMNSVFVYARTVLGIPTDWAFATGAPTGLLLDPWNIRLVPHYLLGVFFVLSHLASGARVVAIAHGCSVRLANRVWWLSTVLCAGIAAAIIAGMYGLRL
ncbi:hypothetical protein [Novosphingobium gossypii]|uniref:hypothetical protein n=1 Tax=Novosphingobium gossypii TaxID=1604774 RepID=UPI003D221F51